MAPLDQQDKALTDAGLEGIVACTSAICTIVGSQLTYRGYDIDDLAEHSNFEEIVFLLWDGRLPRRAELDKLRNELAANAIVPAQVIEALRRFPGSAKPMEVLRTAVSLLALYDPDDLDMSPEANHRKALRLTAQMPTLIAAFHRLRQGLEPVHPMAGKSTAFNFLWMLNEKEPEPVAVDAMDQALILHADHELNASTFSARVTAATLSDIHSAIVSAIGTLKGPLHGGANEQVAAMLEKVGTVENTEPWVKDALERKEKIMGFGHRVYRDGDPRAKHLKRMAQQLSELRGDTRWYEMSVQIEQLVTSAKKLPANVDFYSATVYTQLGIPRDLFTPIFAVSRVAGWTAHVLEQYEHNRLIRPRAQYTGPEGQRWVPVEQRG
ncbi:MAG TPA: citrate synthase [Candidatus Saccharimonadaceae bacterium]|nr:citrate synthase [Candidatus Saccharimonadaceae bacterium]